MFEKTETKFAVSGVIFGLMFPTGAIAFERFLIGTRFSSLSDLIAQNPIHAIVCMAPFVLGATFWRLGANHARLKDQMQRAQAAEKDLGVLVNHDTLTGHGNRHSLGSDIRTLEAEGATGRLLLIDLDKFKFINDTLGHHVGDALLVALSERVVGLLSPSAGFYRLGGDEFVVLDRTCDDAGAAELARRICQAIATPFDVCDTRVTCGCSIGIAAFDPAAPGMSALLARADLALYEAKAEFGNAHSFYTAEMAQEAQTRMSMEQAIRAGMERDEFFLEFQPILGVHAGKLRGFEALARWRHPELGSVPPATFIPIAEISGTIIPLGQKLLELACAEAAKWPNPLTVSVNVSIEQFKHRLFHDQVRSALDRSGLPPGRLILEMTESVFALDMIMIRDVFDRLRRLGVRFALDDFGTGYSSINNLRQLDFDYLKLDGSFASSVLENPREHSLVQTIIDLARHFDLETSAEGIETPEQYEKMCANGISEAQGFLIARPLSAEAIPDYLADHNYAEAGGTAGAERAV